ncbi:MAG: apolipoprotein N-acyltransferase [Bacteroidota bacterium]|nr:apolipoprotein N-acyltransferase [Bacteroidota bacterium]
MVNLKNPDQMWNKIKLNPLFLSLISAILMSAAWYIYPVFSFFGFVPLFILTQTFAGKNEKWADLKYNFWLYLAFVMWNVITTWWVWNASPGGSVAAILCNSFFMTIPWRFYKYAIKRNVFKSDFLHFLVLISFWIGFEYLHLNWELTWPWLTLGNCFAFAHYLVQWYEYTGHLGGTFWILLVNYLVFEVFRTNESKSKQVFTGLIFVVIAIPVFISLTRYFAYEEEGFSNEFVVVQPNVDPYNEKFPDTPHFIPFDLQLERLLDLSEKTITDSTKILAWPETSLPVGFDELLIEDQKYILMIRNFLKKHPNLMLITGSDTYYIYGGKFDASPTARYGEGVGYYDYFNTGMALENNVKCRFYHKSKLVPGVENLPYSYALTFLNNFAIDLGGITGSLGTQKERTVFTSKSGVSVAPVICYESIFGEFVADYVRKGAGYICIITNDGWWGNTPGHVQHLHYARLRAIETRRSVARAANTGISGYMNQRGDIIKTNIYWIQDAMRQSIKMNTYMTFYVTFGDLIGKAASYGCGIFISYFLYIFVTLQLRKIKK